AHLRDHRADQDLRHPRQRGRGARRRQVTEGGALVSTTEPEATVELSIPARPEYVGVARLAILGVASRMRFSYDEVEDIRLAVGEACTGVLDRGEGLHDAPPIVIRCLVHADRLSVEVRDAT